MMINHIALQGRVTKDVELKYTPAGKAVCSFSIASSRDGKTTDFIDCVAWEARAEMADKYLIKGKMVVVEGRLQTRTWKDRDGNNRKAVEIVVSGIHFCDDRKDSAEPVFEPIPANDDLPF